MMDYLLIMLKMFPDMLSPGLLSGDGRAETPKSTSLGFSHHKPLVSHFLANDELKSGHRVFETPGLDLRQSFSPTGWRRNVDNDRTEVGTSKTLLTGDNNIATKRLCVNRVEAKYFIPGFEKNKIPLNVPYSSKFFKVKRKY